MPLINHALKEINAKLVYVGPAGAGKSTNLNYVYGRLKENSRGKFKSMNVQNDRMLFFDFTPSGQGSMDGYSIRFHIYTITGEVSRLPTWKMVLKGVDGLLFVADSAPDRMAANLESLKDITNCLATYGRTLGDIPCVFECNKQDIPLAIDPEGMGRVLNPGDHPMQPAVATRGEGVLECVFSLVKMVLKNIRRDGFDLEEQQDQFQKMTELPGEESRVERPVADAAYDNNAGAESETEDQSTEIPMVGSAGERSAGTSGEEPIVEIAGRPLLLEGGIVRLPLDIRYDGKTKRMSLNISLAPVPD